MFKQAIIKNDYVEVFDTSIFKLIIVLIVEILLGIGLCFIYAIDDGFGRNILLAGFGFFFLVLPTSILPMLKNARKENRELCWAANKIGFLMPEVTAKWTEHKPPVLYDWSKVKGIIFAHKLVYYPDNTRTTANNALIVNIEELELNYPRSLNPVTRYVKDLYRLKDGSYYQVFWYPKSKKAGKALDGIFSACYLFPDCTAPCINNNSPNT